MYVPEHFEMRDQQIEELLTHAEDGLGSLHGHLARTTTSGGTMR